eukprot:358273-Chlamydomonas_euryale.AAC.4
MQRRTGTDRKTSFPSHCRLLFHVPDESVPHIQEGCVALVKEGVLNVRVAVRVLQQPQARGEREENVWMDAATAWVAVQLMGRAAPVRDVVPSMDADRALSVLASMHDLSDASSAV